MKAEHQRILLGSAAAAMLVAASGARAQTAPQTAPSPAPEPAAVASGDADIVITARRRTETLQSVPLAAAVVGGAAIAERGLASIQDLTATVPAVRLAKGSTTDRQFIRGIGSGDNPNFEQSVGTFVDDIYHGRARTSEAGLFDLDRVEVLKGPQTTYFGNNAIAGALNVVTRDPSFAFGGQVRAAYSPTFQAPTIEAAADLPVDDRLAIRVAGLAGRSDGWVYDRGTDSHVPRTRTYGARATILWKPADNVTARIKAQYGEHRAIGAIPLVREQCPPPAAFGLPSGFCAAAIASGAGPLSSTGERNTTPGQFTRLRTQDYIGTLTYDHGPFTLTSTTGFTRYSFDQILDLDTTPAVLLSASSPERYHQISQELRITSDQHGPIEYVAGLYYQHGTLRVRNTFDYGFLTPRIAAVPAFAGLLPYLPFGIDNQYKQSDETLSGFGALTWKIDRRLKATAALRYTHVSKSFDRTIGVGSIVDLQSPAVAFPAAIAGLGAAFAAAGGLATVGTTSLSRKDRQLNPSVTVQYDLTPAIMLYGRYDHGFKAGGFNGVDLTSPAAALLFNPEKVDAFEIGAKTRLFDNRLTLNVDLFRSTYHDLQLAGIVPSASGAYVNRVQNAGGAVTQGVEIEASLRLSPQFRTSVSGSYLDAHYTAYANATPTAAQTLAGAVRQDLGGARTPFAPRFSGTWSVSYSLPLTDRLTLRFANQLYASTGIFLNFNNDPYSRQAGYAREDLSVTLANGRRWELSVIGKNLTDKVIRSFGAALPTSLGSYVYINEPPRNVTLQARLFF